MAVIRRLDLASRSKCSLHVGPRNPIPRAKISKDSSYSSSSMYSEFTRSGPKLQLAACAVLHALDRRKARRESSPYF